MTGLILWFILAQTSPDDSSVKLKDYYELFSTRVTVASKIPTDPRKAPSMVTVIPRAYIETQGYRSVAEALAEVPGFYIVDDGAIVSAAVRGIWGGNDSWSRIIKVMIDGQPVTYLATGGTFLGPEFLSMDAVETIEVVRGPASALYGGNAYLGVINIVTRKLQDGTSFKPSFAVGSINGNYARDARLFGGIQRNDNEQITSFMFAGSDGRLDYSGRTVPPSSPRHNALAGQKSDNDISRPRSGYARAILGQGRAGTFTISALYQRVDALLDFSDVSVLTHKNRLAISQATGRIEHKIEILDRLHLVSNIAAIKSSTLPQQNFDTGQQVPFTLHREHDNTAVSGGVEARLLFDNFTLIAGVDLIKDKDSGDAIYQVDKPKNPGDHSGNQTLRSVPEKLRYTNKGLFFQGTLNIWDFALTAGVRWDKNDKWGSSFTSRFAVVYTPIEDLNIKLLYGTSFLPPAPTQLTAEPLLQGGIRGNTGLRPQTAGTAEFSVNYTYDFLLVEANLFWTHINNRIEITDLLADLYPRNLTDSASYGAEFTGQVSWSRYYLRSSVSVQRSKIDDPKVVPLWWYDVYPKDHNALPGFPKWMGNLALGGSFPEFYFRSSVTLRMSESRVGSQTNIRQSLENYSLPGYTVVDAQLATMGLEPIKGFPTTVRLRVRDLFNRAFAEPGALGVDIPTVGRQVWISLEQEL